MTLAAAVETVARSEKLADLVHVPANLLPNVWPVIKHLVPSIVERSRGRHSMETLIEAVRSGRIELDLAWDGEDVLGIMGTQIGNAPTGLVVATVRFAVGKDSHRWLHLIEEHESNLKARGVKKMEMICRKGWAQKLPSYQMTHIFLEKDL